MSLHKPPQRSCLGLWPAFWLVFMLAGHGYLAATLALVFWADDLGWAAGLRGMFLAMLLSPSLIILAALPVLRAPDRGEGRLWHGLLKTWAALNAIAWLPFAPLALLLLAAALGRGA